MILLTPLTLKGTRSMIAMQRLQPEMKKLQAKYKDDRQKLNEEMLKFYKEHNINPVGGCLPLLLQTPVFIVLYRVLHGLTNPHALRPGHGPGLRPRRRRPATRSTSTSAPSTRATSTPSSQLYKDLSDVREMKSFGLDLATSASEAPVRGHRQRPALPGPHRADRRDRLVPAAPDPGPQPADARRSTPSSRC